MASLDERKPVTVLFADLAGSTELATRHDPEHLRALLTAFFDEMRQQIEAFGGTVAITENRMKFKNLLRDPRCSVLITHADWWSGFLVFEGKAELTHSGNADPAALRLARRHIFSATTRRRSRDWDDYDRITEADKRVAMVLRPDHVYGPALAKMREALAK